MQTARSAQAAPSDAKYIRMTTEPVEKLITKLAVPTIISMPATTFYNLAVIITFVILLPIGISVLGKMEKLHKTERACPYGCACSVWRENHFNIGMLSYNSFIAHCIYPKLLSRRFFCTPRTTF